MQIYAGGGRFPFYAGLCAVSASTLIYEVMLTRLFSVITIYYLALVVVGMAMSGMTVGALFVQLRPSLFTADRFAQRLRQGAFAMGVSIPIALLSMVAVPLGLSRSIEALYSFAMFTALASPVLFLRHSSLLRLDPRAIASRQSPSG